jgi:hypothetical protein
MARRPYRAPGAMATFDIVKLFDKRVELVEAD